MACEDATPGHSTNSWVWGPRWTHGEGRNSRMLLSNARLEVPADERSSRFLHVNPRRFFHRRWCVARQCGVWSRAAQQSVWRSASIGRPQQKWRVRPSGKESPWVKRGAGACRMPIAAIRGRRVDGNGGAGAGQRLLGGVLSDRHPTCMKITHSPRNAYNLGVGTRPRERQNWRRGKLRRREVGKTTTRKKAVVSGRYWSAFTCRNLQKLSPRRTRPAAARHAPAPNTIGSSSPRGTSSPDFCTSRQPAAAPGTWTG